MNNGNGLSNREVLHQTVDLIGKFSKEYAELNVNLLWITTALPKSPFKIRLIDTLDAVQALLTRTDNVSKWAKGCEELGYEPEDSDFQNAYDLVGDIEDHSREVIGKIIKLQEDFERVKIDSTINNSIRNARKLIKEIVDIYQNTYDMNRKLSS